MNLRVRDGTEEGKGDGGLSVGADSIGGAAVNGLAQVASEL